MKIKFLLILAFILTDAVAFAQNNNAILTFEEAKELADQGDARAQAITSMFYRIGWQTDKNEMLAEEYVTKSVNAGHPLGAYYFGKYLVEGINGKKDESRGHQIQKESFEPLRLIAADNSKPDPVAVTAIGEMLMEGKACAQDKRKGIDCFKWAAQHHYIPA